MKRNQTDVEPSSRVVAGDLLWTLTRASSTAQARRWHTAHGLELELHIWSGARVQGEEDLAWCQRFPSVESFDAAASAKKSQLLASGWLEEIETTVG